MSKTRYVYISMVCCVDYITTCAYISMVCCVDFITTCAYISMVRCVDSITYIDAYSSHFRNDKHYKHITTLLQMLPLVEL